MSSESFTGFRNGAVWYALFPMTKAHRSPETNMPRLSVVAAEMDIARQKLTAITNNQTFFDPLIPAAGIKKPLQEKSILKGLVPESLRLKVFIQTSRRRPL
jgi:hypothetical protein